MPACTVTRTHRLGRKLAQHDWPQPVSGPVEMASIHRKDLNRVVGYLHIPRSGAGDPEVIPPLWEPHWLTFGTNGGMVVTGFEEVDGTRYYQSWYIRWE